MPRPLRLLLAPGAMLLLPLSAPAQPRVLDDFATLAGWASAKSEGAQARLAPATGRNGAGALSLEFDLSRAYGHALARKDFALELADNFQLAFDLRADSPVNNLEVKLIDEFDNVWMHKRLSYEFPSEWTTQRLRRRHFSYAWGPKPTAEIRRVKAIEFVVAASTGGTGRLQVSHLRFGPVDDSLAATARASLGVSAGTIGRPALDDRGDRVTGWRTAAGAGDESLTLDFGYERELGGLILDWAPGKHAPRYAVEVSFDGVRWDTLYAAQAANGGRDYVPLPEQQGRWLRFAVPAGAGPAAGVELASLEVQGPAFATTPNAFFGAIAQRERRGLFPPYLVGRQLYWTAVGSPADPKEALLAETGQLEVDQSSFSIEPFLLVGGQLVTWNDVERTQSLEAGYLPIPSVTWQAGGLKLEITAFAAGPAGPDSVLLARYRLENAGAPVQGRLFLAVRPFQVNPPWQSIFRPAGWARIGAIELRDGALHADGRAVIPLDRPDGFGATVFESGEITEHLLRGELPAARGVRDPLGSASAAFAYDFALDRGAAREIHLASPFHEGGAPIAANRPAADAARCYAGAHAATRRTWEGLLDRFQVRLPAFAQPVIDTLKSNLAYVFINQDGPRIQPGSRNYQRSWIRDGSLTSTALLELGLKDEVRDFADWYSRFIFPSGKVPCVVDDLGADPTDEHDSHGQFLHLVMQVYHHTQDKAWLRTQWPNIVRVVGFIRSLRAQRKTAEFRDGPPGKRVFYGLVPASISHEGYSAAPMHSYWDDFFVLRGLKDATTIAGLLGEREAGMEFAAERDDLRKDLHASIRLAMHNKGIDFIPGCAELGDFDATSTTIALVPAGEAGHLPQPALARTFERYWERFVARRDGRMEWLDFTPYENRVIGSFVYLGQRDRAQAALDYFMAHRRPAGWNHWAEVVFRDPATPRMIGDMPHTWCGSDFIRSVRAMFVYEREEDEALVLGAGLAGAWVEDPAGVEVAGLPTHYGNVDYTLKSADGGAR
ncbi:MAG: coagulation factor 5/8 type domain-containing protein, partial [Opitutus sp.]|nr:coagulation factor 5/8 type domain-containing protein [Opitutus sp.]